MFVSQAPAVSEAPTGVTPIAGGASLSTLPSTVQYLTRFFLSLSGSSSLRAFGGVAGVAASTAGSGVQLCPSTSACGAVALGAATAIPAGAGNLPAAPAAVPGVSGHQQRQEDSPLQEASSSLVQRWDRQTFEEASQGEVSFSWSFFSLSGEALSGFLEFF